MAQGVRRIPPSRNGGAAVRVKQAVMSLASICFGARKESRRLRRCAIFLGMVAYVLAPVAEAAPPVVVLHVLANGYVRLDDGPLLRPSQLPLQLTTLADPASVRPLRVVPDGNATYASVAKVLAIVGQTDRRLRRHGRGGFEFGFVGEESPN